MRFDIVDVFAERKYAGNQLAVIRDAGALSSEEMQSIARETNYSETTFVVDEQSATVRIFTPAEELPFAGHPTLGTAFLLMGSDKNEITLQLKVGPIRVWREEGLVWMRQRAPTFSAPHDAAEVAAALNVEARDIAGPVETVSTGLPHIVVPMRSLDALRRAKVDDARYRKLVAHGDAKCAYPFAVGASDPKNHVTARQFAPTFGIVEDPATGSGVGCLAAYLARHQVLGSAKVDARVEQGAQIGRPSLLHIRAEGERVEVGGRVVRVVEGKLVR